MHTLRNLYFNFIDSNILEKCQKLVRIITSPRLAHDKPMLDQVNIKHMDIMYTLKIAPLMYKVHHQLYPPVLLNLFDSIKRENQAKT